MTTHYLDIIVSPDPETTVSQLLGALYDKVHMKLVDQRIDGVGVSFPRYSTSPRTLGNLLRLHGSKVLLEPFLEQEWLKGVRDHVRFSTIEPAPSGAPHRILRRKQFKTSADRLRRRRMKRKGESEEQASSAIPLTMERKPDLPFVKLRSHSTGQPYALFIALSEPSAQAVLGVFNSHGLGGKASIPWF